MKTFTTCMFGNDLTAHLAIMRNLKFPRKNYGLTSQIRDARFVGANIAEGVENGVTISTFLIAPARQVNWIQLL